ncbi:hypothetical protein EON63_06095 [archaeon]|nr:MAG: hypothetical protein EON63_06095 [archaeon]
MKEDPIFVDTLDYIFLSPEWEVKGTEQLPKRDEIQGPLPNTEEPSDHILISATLSIINK